MFSFTCEAIDSTTTNCTGTYGTYDLSGGDILNGFFLLVIITGLLLMVAKELTFKI